MSDELPTPDDVVSYYGSNPETDRLERGLGALEFGRTKEIVLRFLNPRSVVADVGGAAGHYAEWLAEAGHRVELVEPVSQHVELARERAGDPLRFGVHLADARALPFAEETFDAVLLLGPLYHLGEAEDRVDALVEATRVCRTGGVIVAAAISRFAPLLDTIHRGRILEDRVFANVQDETVGGRRVPPERRSELFPDAYFHLPAELASELKAAGLDVEGVYGVEGPGWLVRDIDALWSDTVARERILWAAKATETDPHLIAVSPHLLAVATKPAG